MTAQYSAGTGRVVTLAPGMPLKPGMATGTMMSELLPGDVSIGISAITVVAGAIKAGRTGPEAPSITPRRTVL